MFNADLAALRNKRELHRGSKLWGLTSFVDLEGVLWAKGRVTRVDSQVYENTPIILDASHPAVKTLVRNYHRRYFHANNETVVNELKQKFYIVGLQNRLRWLTKECFVCRLSRAKADNPQMVDLSACRLAMFKRPFTETSIDYFEPMLIKIGCHR